uniref:Uncharacterized protein n=1 Tax=Anguilla anguilla TaxID=7936 RepID=A0A0E9TDD3_ANGAN
MPYNLRLMLQVPGINDWQMWNATSFNNTFDKQLHEQHDALCEHVQIVM